MRLYHYRAGRIHNVGISFNYPFVATDLSISTKGISPTQVYPIDKKEQDSLNFYCFDCGTNIEIPDIKIKCCKCGEMFPLKELVFHSKSNMIFCLKHSDSNKEDEKETTRPMLSFIEKFVVK
jgi:hypothetical protein